MNVFRNFPALVASLGIDPRHIVHCGAHLGEEVVWYLEAGFRRITLIEPIPDLAAKLRADHRDAEVVECACSDAPGDAVLHLMRRTNMSTLLPPARGDRTAGSIRVSVRRLDDVAPDANVAVIDAQGLELAVLRGANLAALDLVVVETCTVPDRTMAAGYDDVVAFMTGRGFALVDYWARDYGFVHRWARGRATQQQGEVRDLIFAKETSSA